MSRRSIPAALEAAVYERIQQKHTIRDITHWLREEHGLQTTHTSVHRLVERLRYSRGAIPELEAELEESRGRLGSHIRALEALADEYAEMAEDALLGDPEQGLKPNLRLAAQLYSRQQQVMRQWERIVLPRSALRPATKPAPKVEPPAARTPAPAPKGDAAPPAKPAPAPPDSSPDDTAAFEELRGYSAEMKELMAALQQRTRAAGF